MAEFDAERVSRTINAALAGPGGIGLVVSVFAGLPGVAHTPARRGSVPVTAGAYSNCATGAMRSPRTAG